MAGTGGIRKMINKATKTAKKMLAGVFKSKRGGRRTVKAGRRRRSRH